MSNAMAMYVGWECNENYDMAIVDWRCDVNANATLWAAHQFLGGYNCFLNGANVNQLLFAKWNGGQPNQKAEIEYISPLSDSNNLDFDNEGTGKHIFTKYHWEENTWYSSCIGVKSMYGKTFYAQWVRIGHNTPWILTGVISVPGEGAVLTAVAPFQEDFSQTEADREFHLKDAYGHSINTNSWVNWQNYQISNAYFSYDPYSKTQNYPHKCNWGVKNNYVWIKTGLNVEPSSGNTLPDTVHLNQPSNPNNPPVWFDYCLPRKIKSRHSNLYISYDPNTNNVVQKTIPTYWNFIDTGDGFFYIMIDNTKVITFDLLVDGADLYITNLNRNNDNQKWQKKSLNGQGFYFVPKNSFGSSNIRAIEIEDSQLTENAKLQLFLYYENEPRYQWDVNNEVKRVAIKNKYSGLYLTPTSANKLIQTYTKYIWNIVYTNDNKFYILTQDNTLAVTVSNLANGADLQMTSFNPLNQQAWSKISVTGDYNRLVPECGSSFTMDVEEPSTQSGASIQIWTYGTGVNQFLWTLEEIK